MSLSAASTTPGATRWNCGDSFLGVPGLVDAARAGNVAISNALGSGAVETTALLAFLPALAQHLLGEDVAHPECRDVVVRTAATSANIRWEPSVPWSSNAPSSADRTSPGFGEDFDPVELEALAARIRANPHDYVAQERVALSTAPVWNGDLLEPRPLMLRCYTCAAPDGFAVMPGGLTRVSSSPDSPIVSSRYGGGSKDTWVRGCAPVEEIEAFQPSTPLAKPERIAGNVPSRVVENLFWLGRYTERLEDRIRLLRTAFGWLAGEGGPVGDQEMAALTRWLAHSRYLPAYLGGRSGGEDLTSELWSSYSSAIARGASATCWRVSC